MFHHFIKKYFFAVRYLPICKFSYIIWWMKKKKVRYIV